MKFISIFILILVIGGCITGYSYWLENSASEILSTEIPAQENLLAQEKSEIRSLQENASRAYQKYQEAQKKYEDYWQQKIIEQAIMALLPSPISILSKLNPIKEIGPVFDLLDTMGSAAKIPNKVAEIEGAFRDIQAIQGYYRQYQSIQNELEQKKKLFPKTEEKIRQLRITAIAKTKKASVAKIVGGVTLSIGVLGAIIFALTVPIVRQPTRRRKDAHEPEWDLPKVRRKTGKRRKKSADDMFNQYKFTRKSSERQSGEDFYDY